VKRIIAAYPILILLLVASLQLGAQTTHLDSVKSELQGAWRMNADTNMYLVFTADSVVHHMFRTSGTGRSKYEVTPAGCEPNLPPPGRTLYIVETYRYYQYKEPREGRLCSEIVRLKNGTLILRRDKITETYTKLKAIPAPH